MYEFHGWFVISETPDEDDEGGLPQILAEIESKVRDLSWVSGAANLVPANIQQHLVLTGLSNHERGLDNELRGLLSFICERAPGSYGLMSSSTTEPCFRGCTR